MLFVIGSRSVRCVSLVALAASLASFAPLVQASPVALCAFPQSPTQNVDFSVTAAVFKQLGMAYREVDLQSDIGKRAASEFTIAQLLKTKCDVFVGVPTAAADMQFKQGFAISSPYMTASFVKFRLAGQPTAASGDDSSVAVAYESPAELIAAEEKDGNFDVENTTAEVIDAVVAGRAQAGIAWYPSLVAYERGHGGVHFDVQPTRTSISNWTLRFVASNAQHKLVADISSAIGRLSRSGELHDITMPWTLRDTAATVPVGAQQRLEPAVYHASETGSGARSILVSDRASAAQHKANFSAAQITPGKKLYAAECAQCHGDELQGHNAPALRGPGFAPPTNSTFTVGGIFQYVTTNMPADKPGQLKPKEYADIMAYLLYANGYSPSGKTMTANTAGDDQSPLNSYVK